MAIKADALIVAPHTDDAEFGIAGTVCNWVHQGKVVVYCIVTNGDKGTSDTTLTPAELVELRQKEQWDAARKLGVADVAFLGYHDQELEDSADLRKDIVRQIRLYRPETVATTDPYRRYIWHRDHRICGQVVMDAVYPFARDHLAYPDLFAQGYLPHKVKEVLTWGTEDPNYWSDITESFESKIAALACHKSQVGRRDSHQLYLQLKSRATDMAKGQSFKLAEAFHRVEILM